MPSDIQNLRALVAELAVWPESWDRLARRDQRLSVVRWEAHQDSGFHSHDHSSGAVAVVRGELLEERVQSGRPSATRIWRPGQILDFGPGEVHRLVSVGAEPALTLHAFAPVPAACAHASAGALLAAS